MEHFMQSAIELGKKAIPLCMDNPPVGCVLVRNNKIVARGHTNKPGAPHAEAMALSHLTGESSDVAAFVTLEPCSFHGRTPSCAATLIKSGIKSVYVGIVDPDLRNNGKGIAMMKAAGIDVYVGALSSVIVAQLQDFLGHAH
ncbi:MAG: bifunctional diaminohydroxyphosphoribosylaminopyrimidine deaminase/5-amino-6-(5-phosphoribosylamino)uracil reductase RibD [Pseudomonadota bacterium]